jgi:heme/copper-type cytochrome/quinol oxidase subunit 3
MSVAHTEQAMGVSGEAAHQGGRSLGWWGMVFFIASESLLFANLIAGYLYLRVRAGTWPPPGQGDLKDIALPIVNTVILLSSSYPINLAGRAIAGRKPRLLFWRLTERWTPWLILTTIILGSIFLSIQAVEYSSNNFGISNNLLGSTFYTVTGFHGAHVAVGIILLLVNFFRAVRGQFTRTNHFSLAAGEMYWHFVDVVWIFVFTLVYVITVI